MICWPRRRPGGAPRAGRGAIDRLWSPGPLPAIGPAFPGGDGYRRPAFAFCRGAAAGSSWRPLYRQTRQYDSRVSGISAGQVPDPEATVLVERRPQASMVFAFVVVACAAALFRGVTGAQTTGGRAAVAVLFGAVLLFLIVGAIRWSRNPRRRLEITADAIRYVQSNGRVSALSRQWGDELRQAPALR
jgi:hypothetical protein